MSPARGAALSFVATLTVLFGGYGVLPSRPPFGVDPAPTSLPEAALAPERDANDADASAAGAALIAEVRL